MIDALMSWEARNSNSLRIIQETIFNIFSRNPQSVPYRLIGLMDRAFAKGPGDLISIPLKMVLDTSLLNTQQYKVRIKGIVEQSRERSSALPYTSV